MAEKDVVLFLKASMTVCVGIMVALGVAGLLANDLRYLIPMGIVHVLMLCIVFEARRRLIGPYARMVGHLGGANEARKCA